MDSSRSANRSVPSVDLSIMHVIGPAAFGGMERVVQSLACAQRRAGRDVRVVAVLDEQDAEHPFFAPLDAAGVPHRTVVAPGRSYRRELKSLEQVLAEQRPNVVHTHGRRSDVTGVLASRRARIPCIATVHGAIGGSLRNRMYMRIQHRTLRKADAVVAVSSLIAEKLCGSGVHRDRVRVIRNAWVPTGRALDRGEARAELGLPPDAEIVGWVGRLSSEKGADVFVDAIATIDERPLVASLIGEGVEREALQSQIERSGLQDRVRLQGALPDAGRLFRAFDCFVLSSHTEGTPMVLLEAMAAGTPIVATRVGGVTDVIGAADGILVPAGDVGALADGIRNALSDRASAAERCASAKRRLLERFGTDAWVRQYDEVYAGVVSAAPAGAAR